jgi:ABC-type uncharacterized transport system permease subunit
MILSSPLSPALAGDAVGAAALTVASAAALLAYLAAAMLGERGGAVARAPLLVGWLAHGVAIAVDVFGVGAATHGARFGFAPVLSMTIWLVLAVYAVENRFVPIAGLRRTLALLAAAMVVVAWLFPGEARPQASSPWAPLHWVLGVGSYALFGAAVFHGALLGRAEQRLRDRSTDAPLPGGVPLLRLERLTFHFITAGFVMLSAALIAGAWFSAPWRWDHKTVFSVLGWVVFAALLAGRRAFGWRGARVTRWLYVGSALLLLAYAGSRFVFEVLLHRPPPPGA